MPESRVIPTADALRSLDYGSPMPGWHRHGNHLIPTDGCASCAELRRRQASNGSSPDTAASSLIDSTEPSLAAVKEIPENDETAAQPEG